MKEETFLDELDLQLKSGAGTFPDSDIDIDSFHLVDSLRAKMRTIQIAFALTASFLLLLTVFVLFFFLLPSFQKKFNLFPGSELKKIQANHQLQVSQLMSENAGLTNKIDSLEKQIEIAKTMALNPEPNDISSGNLGADGTIRHLVEKGETLYSLAKEYYGSGSLYETLANDNNLKSPQDLAEGMTLKIYPQKNQP